LGFLISLAMVLMVHTYGFFIDFIYSYHNFLESFSVVVLFSFPIALHLWIMNHLMQSKTYTNPNHRLLFKIVASYWIGTLYSMLHHGFLLSLRNFCIASVDKIYHRRPLNYFKFIGWSTREPTIFCLRI